MRRKKRGDEESKGSSQEELRLRLVSIVIKEKIYYFIFRLDTNNFIILYLIIVSKFFNKCNLA